MGENCILCSSHYNKIYNVCRFQPLFQPKGVGYYEPSPQPSSYLRQEDPYQNM